MKISYDKEKDLLLQEKRNISFDKIIECITDDKVVTRLSNKGKYSHQSILLIDIDNYIWAVPYIEDKEGIFLKTAFPSRKYTKIYKKEKKYAKNIK